ncbi:MAG: 1-deoxy-D-xylulose-5-phosphate reductoisomerase [Armatimonadota bacterium]|nr:1-deoxy-D-xylulose-5-phosphate reductoisomerase [Armatimonadota bacterium]MDR7532892.1 1-deoxy-D-xylulose-5-phosphate reductoisomerase [Armatimonadota bacterium]MDR7536099.1 1-deoxy-D-xylulose-5-phosphate reductoisomerase [Armatimonadota bacterium]
MRRLVVLGSTGSVGRAALEVAAALGDVEVVGLSARHRHALLAAQARRFRVRAVAVEDPAAAAALEDALPAGTRVLSGPQAATTLALLDGADVVLVALVGVAGLAPTLAALSAGRDVALATKEALVAGGHLVAAAAARSGARLIPIDSEHAAIAQCLLGQDRGAVRRLILTASGGPFLRRAPDELWTVTVQEALAHPTWNMGTKVTIDSATLMNKGLEIIEARWLFDVAPEQIDVVIHPQSIVHAMVEFADGMVLAQMSRPDMRGPIQFALTGPQRRPGLVAPVDWHRLGLTFEAPEAGRFPALDLAREALRLGGTAPAVLNAANEVAVGQFLEGRIRFPEIVETVRAVLARCSPLPAPTLDAVLAADAWAREEAARAARVVR